MRTLGRIGSTLRFSSAPTALADPSPQFVFFLKSYFSLIATTFSKTLQRRLLSCGRSYFLYGSPTEDDPRPGATLTGRCGTTATTPLLFALADSPCRLNPVIASSEAVYIADYS
jgi:hypothetical protein